jgi:hypothetical protein
VVLSVEPEVPSHHVPALASPAHESTLTVEVSTHALVPSAPHPASASVGISRVQVPIRANLAPASAVIAVQGSEAILVVTDSSVSSPTPLRAAVEAVVCSDQVPVPTNHQPSAAAPSAQNSHAIDVAPNALCLATPEPPT